MAAGRSAQSAEELGGLVSRWQCQRSASGRRVGGNMPTWSKSGGDEEAFGVPSACLRRAFGKDLLQIPRIAARP